MKRTRRASLIATTLALALLSGCFEPLVKERIELRFLPDGAAALGVVVEFADEARGKPAQRRLEEARRAAIDGTDAWSRRVAVLEPDVAAERFVWEKKLGEVSRVERRVVLAPPEVGSEPAALPRFFGDTSLGVDYSIREGMAELRIVPGSGGRADRAQRERVDTALEEWSGQVAEYFADAGALWEYLERRPQRAEACLAALFADVLPADDRPRAKVAGRAETRLVEKLEKSMDAVLAVLQTPEQEEESLDEASRAVFDPFPAPIEVRLPSAPQTVEGFERQGGEAWRAEGPSLWNALRGLQGQWLTPDPAAFVVAAATGGKASLDEFLAKRRWRSTPSPGSLDVRRALLDGLAAKPLFLLRWPVKSGEGAEGAEREEPFSFDD
jgi:hypothetical protein